MYSNAIVLIPQLDLLSLHLRTIFQKRLEKCKLHGNLSFWVSISIVSYSFNGFTIYCMI